MTVKTTGGLAGGFFWLLIMSTAALPPYVAAADPALPLPQGTGATPPGPASGPQLTLEDVVRIALDNQSNVKSAEFQIRAQDAIVHQQLSAYYPTINFNNSFRTANVGGIGSKASNSFDTLSSAANLNLILYNFGKREGLVQSARETLEATRYAYSATANNTVLAAKQAYYGVLQATALLAVQEETVKDRAETLRQTQGFYDVGTKPRSDVTQAEANLYLAQANLITARNGVDVAWASLRKAMGVDELPRQPLAEELALTPFAMSLDEAKNAAFSSRPELLQFDSLLKAQDQLIAVARRNHLPDLLLSSSYGRQNTSQDAALLPLQPSWQVQLSLNIPVFNGFQTTYQVQQALFNYESTREQRRVEKQQVAFDVEQNYLNLIAARDAVRANEAAVKAAKENLELHEARYQVGYAPIVEVTDAQTTYTAAQTSYVNALIAYKLAYAQLINAIGAR
ncbi:MAG TPA: TolC family protein [Candidatus Binatia bacterium]|jgi:TolC family type I secretion outer membrane protein